MSRAVPMMEVWPSGFPGQRRAVVACSQPGGCLRAALAVPGVEVA
jgi:hypothetical protein